MASLTHEQVMVRTADLVSLADKRDVSLAHIEIRDPFAWIAFVEELLDVDPGSPLPTR